MATALAARGSGAAPAQQAQEARAEPARGAEGARGDLARDWDAIPDLLGGEALPLVMEVYGWLSWDTSGTTRGLRNRTFDAVLLGRDGGNRGVPPGGVGGPEGPRNGPPGRDRGGALHPPPRPTGFHAEGPTPAEMVWGRLGLQEMPSLASTEHCKMSLQEAPSSWGGQR